jgi:hypothetical protein
MKKDLFSQAEGTEDEGLILQEAEKVSSLVDRKRCSLVDVGLGRRRDTKWLRIAGEENSKMIRISRRFN